LETSEETADFFDQMRDDRPTDHRLEQHLGVNYDTCHLAVEFEEPAEVIERFNRHGIRISKLHLSSALKVQANVAGIDALRKFNDPVYFHQVISRTPAGKIRRYRDLDLALNAHPQGGEPGEEWRVHFHIPLHNRPARHFDDTSDHLLGVLDNLA